MSVPAWSREFPIVTWSKIAHVREYSRIRAIALCAIVVHPLKGSGTLRAEMPIHPFEVGSNLNNVEELDCKYDKSLSCVLFLSACLLNERNSLCRIYICSDSASVGTAV